MLWIRRSHEKHRGGQRVRGLAVLLCLILCLESAPLAALAAETDTLPVNTAEERSEDFNEQQTPSAGEEETAPAENSETPPEKEEEELPAEDADTPPEGGEKEAPAEDIDTPPAEDEEPIPPEETEQTSGNEADSISENDLSSVSENDLSSISENSLDTERETMIMKAQEAFAALIAEKPLMALLYHTDSYDARRKADADSDAAATLEIGQTLYIQGVEITEDDVWYQAQYLLNGTEGTGYVQSYYLAYSDEDWLAWEEEYLLPILALGEDEYESTAYGMQAYSMMTYAVDTSDISAFPGSYQSALRSLKSAHPNWTFVPMKTGLDFNSAVSNEMGDKSLIQNTSSNASKGWVGSACPTESGWYYATRPAVSYHMDPRNFLTETYIFQFEQLTFNASYHTEAAVQSFLNGTFMKGKLADDSAGRTYAKAFYEIGSGRKLSPIHLASRVYQEQGQGTSGLISGTYPGYEGYYNFFNVGVNGSSTAEKIVKGLTYAKEQGWNTRYKSLSGGAGTIGNNYVLKGQDTIYLEKFNVDKNSSYGVYNHQYMQNIQAPQSESTSTKNMYAKAGSLNSAFVFKIPIYDNMPAEEPEIPLQNISLDKETVTLRRPDTVVEDTKNLSASDQAENISETTLQVRFDPADTTADKTIVWTSADPKIANVKADPADSSKAVVTAVGTGEVKITAKASEAGNQSAVCMVRVIAPIYRLELSDLSTEEGAGKTELFQGQSVGLNAEYWPKDTTSDNVIVWSSSNEKAATVRNGRVTAEGEGKATIRAAVAGYSASVEVSVKACKIIFHMEDGTIWKGKELSPGYGGCVADVGAFPEIKSTADKIFRGWYTEKDGQGSVFTENHPVYAEETHVYPHYQEIGPEKGFYVIPVGDQIYTGSAIKPKVRVFDSTVTPDGSLAGGENGEVLELVEGSDYTLSYKNNKNVNAEGKARPTITVKGKGNYAGTQQIFFDILPKALTDADIKADDITTAYSGRVIKGAPTVWQNEKKLVRNTDYTLTYPQTGTGAYQAAGVYPIVIKGKGGYTGTITVYETITKKTLMSKVSVARIANRTYSNEEMAQKGGIRPDFLKVTYKGETLVESTDDGRTGDYTVAYQNDTAIGTATATITAVEGSEYTGSKSVTYKIVGTPIARAKVEGIETKTYTGTAEDVQQSGYTLTIEEKTLVESKDGGKIGDYIVSYAGAAKSGAAKAGTATIVFQGINEYSGQLKKNYKIQPYPFDETEVGKDIKLFYRTQDQGASEKEIPLTDLNGITTPYVKGGSKPAITVVFRGQTLVQGKDYAVSYKNHNALTIAEMEEKKLPAFTISGRGNFKGKLTGTFTITDGRMDKQGKISMSLKDVVYRERKNAYKAAVTLKDVNGASLAAGRDYDRDLQYDYAKDAIVLVSEEGGLVEQERRAGDSVGEADIPKAGTVIRVTAKGIGAYAGEKGSGPGISASYRIVAADIAKAKVKVAAKAYQDGRPVTLSPEDLTVTLNGVEEPLVIGKDYEILKESYVNHIKKGKAKVTIRGLGNYGGEKIITYSIGAKSLWW